MFGHRQYFVLCFCSNKVLLEVASYICYSRENKGIHLFHFNSHLLKTVLEISVSAKSEKDQSKQK